MSDIITNKHKKIRLAIIVATAIFSIAAISIYFIVTEPTRQKEKCLEEYRQFVSAIEATNTEYDYHTWETNMAKKDSFHLRLKEYELEPEEHSEIVRLDEKLINIRTGLWEKAADKFTSSLSRGSSVVGRIIDTNVAKVFYLIKGATSISVFDIAKNTSADITPPEEYYEHGTKIRQYDDRIFVVSATGACGSGLDNLECIYYIDMLDNSTHNVVCCAEATFMNNGISVERYALIDDSGCSAEWEWEKYSYMLPVSLSDKEYSELEKEQQEKQEQMAEDAKARLYRYNNYGGNDINNISWLYGYWTLQTGGFYFGVTIKENRLIYNEISNGIPTTIWDGDYTLYMNRIVVNGGTTLLLLDLGRKKIYSPKGEAFRKR